jgi:hypothetical protein
VIVGEYYILHLPVTVSLAALILKPPKERSGLCACLEYARLSSNAAAVWNVTHCQCGGAFSSANTDCLVTTDPNLQAQYKKDGIRVTSVLMYSSG